MSEASKVPHVRLASCRRTVGAVAWMMLLALGCNGKIAAGGSSGTGGTGASTGGADLKDAGPLPLRRLTSREYLNTARDLLGDTTLGVADVPGESDDLSNDAFPFRQPNVIGTLDAGNLQAAAEALATNIASKLSTVLP